MLTVSFVAYDPFGDFWRHSRSHRSGGQTHFKRGYDVGERSLGQGVRSQRAAWLAKEKGIQSLPESFGFSAQEGVM
jgi:hypothetical protein